MKEKNVKHVNFVSEMFKKGFFCYNKKNYFFLQCLSLHKISEKSIEQIL